MRDRYLCRMCGAPAELVHHIKHIEAWNCDDIHILCDASNLMSVCRECHHTLHIGEHAKGRLFKAECEYEFDENGQYVPKKVDIPT